MSSPLYIALVAEGPTDGVVIETTLRSILHERPFVLRQIFPEGSASFSELGTGWVGVYRWCHQSAGRGAGQLQRDALIFQTYDLLILHLDADVAGSQYGDGAIMPNASDGLLPCERDCPPPSDTTNALRAVLLSWCGEATAPVRTVICTPSKSTEAWVVAALFPADRSMADGIECYHNPESRMGQQPISRRIRKRKRDYDERAKDLEAAWPRLVLPNGLSEGRRFQADFLDAVRALAV
jgi:hypothetical protein